MGQVLDKVSIAQLSSFSHLFAGCWNHKKYMEGSSLKKNQIFPL